MNPVSQITQVRSAASLVFGTEGREQQQISQQLRDAAATGKLRRFRFDGRLHFAPLCSKGDASFVVSFAEETTRRAADSGCMQWAGACKTRQGPVVTLDGKEYILRRAVYEHHSSKKLKTHEAIRMTCGDPTCIAHAHMVKEPRNALLVGRPRPVATRQRIAEKHRDRMPYSREQVSELKACCARGELSHAKAAKVLGVSPQAMNQIVRGESWRDFSSPYQSLLDRSKQ